MHHHIARPISSITLPLYQLPRIIAIRERRDKAEQRETETDRYYPQVTATDSGIGVREQTALRY